MGDIKNNIENIQNYICKYNYDARLVAVSKYRNEGDIIKAIEAGQKIFGENRIQEAKAKWDNIKSSFPDIKLHLIGALQSNKCADAVKIFDVIEVVDRKKLIDCLSKEVLKQQKKVDFLIQVNISDETQKSGCKIENLEQLIDYSKKKGLNVTGLMCIPLIDADPKDSFQKLRLLCNKFNLNVCSMGMSNDYKIALQVGATHIRVGTGIFGKRPAP